MPYAHSIGNTKRVLSFSISFFGLSVDLFQMKHRDFNVIIELLFDVNIHRIRMRLFMLIYYLFNGSMIAQCSMSLFTKQMAIFGVNTIFIE